MKSVESISDKSQKVQSRNRASDEADDEEQDSDFDSHY